MKTWPPFRTSSIRSISKQHFHRIAYMDWGNPDSDRTALCVHGLKGLLTTRIGPGAFYEFIPWISMVVWGMAISLYSCSIFVIGGRRFWRDLPPLGQPTSLRPLLAAMSDVLTLRYLRGGGPVGSVS